MNWRWLPNAICMARMLLVAPIVWLLLEERYAAALMLIVVAGASDGLDGFLAKTFGWQTRLGSLLDPAADKLLLVSVFLSLACTGAAPRLLVAIVVIRDVVIVMGAVLYQLLVAPLRGEPTRISKLNTGAQLALVVLTVAAAAFALQIDALLMWLGALVIFTSIVSGLSYVHKWARRAWQVAHAPA
jgi:cardiolipin synthase